jgi:uncharacterized membrane protein
MDRWQIAILHHRLLRLNRSQSSVVAIIYGLTAWAGLAGNTLAYASGWSWTNLIALVLVITFVNRTAWRTAALPISSGAIGPIQLELFSSEV